MLEIREGAVTDAAQQIHTIMTTIAEDMKAIDTTFKAEIPEGVDTKWSDTLLTNWETYYGQDVPKALEDISNAALALQDAVEAAVNYSNEG